MQLDWCRVVEAPRAVAPVHVSQVAMGLNFEHDPRFIGLLRSNRSLGEQRRKFGIDYVVDVTARRTVIYLLRTLPHPELLLAICCRTR